MEEFHINTDQHLIDAGVLVINSNRPEQEST